MDESLLADVKSEGNVLTEAFDRIEAKGEEPSESRTEKKEPLEGEETPASKGKDSGKWREMRQTVAQAKKEAAEARAEIEKLKSASTQTEPPEWWKKQYGDTPESKQRYATVVSKDGELDWIKQSILNELDQRSQAETAQATEANEYVDTQLQELTDEGEKFERNALLKFMVDFQGEFGAGSLLDQEGNYDFRKGLTLMRKLQPEEPEEDASKRLAGQAGRARSPVQGANKIPVVTRKDLRRGWRDAGI